MIKLNSTEDKNYRFDLLQLQLLWPVDLLITPLSSYTSHFCNSWIHQAFGKDVDGYDNLSSMFLMLILTFGGINFSHLIHHAFDFFTFNNLFLELMEILAADSLSR